jgi:CheY-like chemotaxis protein
MNLPLSFTSPRHGGQAPVILLAEDRPDDVIIMRKALAKTNADYRLFVVPDGELAIAYLQGTGSHADRVKYPLPSLLLLDLKMPRKDGFEVLEWIRSQPDLFALRVVVLSSSQVQSDIDRAYELGASSYLVKPDEFENYLQLTEFINGFWLLFNQAVADPEPSSAPG